MVFDIRPVNFQTATQIMNGCSSVSKDFNIKNFNLETFLTEHNIPINKTLFFYGNIVDAWNKGFHGDPFTTRWFTFPEAMLLDSYVVLMIQAYDSHISVLIAPIDSDFWDLSGMGQCRKLPDKDVVNNRNMKFIFTNINFNNMHNWSYYPEVVEQFKREADNGEISWVDKSNVHFILFQTSGNWTYSGLKDFR